MPEGRRLVLSNRESSAVTWSSTQRADDRIVDLENTAWATMTHKSQVVPILLKLLIF